ncbi:MAG: hypothetical protein J5651_00955 [Salinivirgaceae bacterium]|nr:hypothetical protein [Salinivirgaceae bacterium]MBO7595168.1 hypothetical protein [Salinivirgaceae bacterium]
MVDNIGIVDTRNIISAIAEKFGIDMSDYASTILRRRLVHTINAYTCHSADDFIDKVKRGAIDVDDFLYEMAVETTEIFRDPSLWRELRDRYLPEVCRTPDCQIWMPGITTGDELYTLEIVLAESGLQNKAKVVAGCPSNKHIENIKNGGLYDPKKIEVSEANYTRYVGKSQFNSYYTMVDNHAKMKNELLANATIYQKDILKTEANKQYRMIIYRNTLLQFNIPLYEKVIRKLTESLAIGGYLIIGNMETLEYSETGKKMQVVNENEKIYKKRID